MSGLTREIVEKTLEDHKCGRDAFYTWQPPAFDDSQRTLWLVINLPDFPQRFCAINYCPFCGYANKGEHQTELIGFLKQKTL